MKHFDEELAFADPQVRPARLADLRELSAIKVRTSLMWPSFRRPLLDDPEWITVPAEAVAEGRTLVIEARGETAGFATLESRSDGDVEVHNIFVDPGHWGSTTPRDLIEALVAAAATRGAWAIWMVVPADTRAFYEASGFFADDSAAPGPDMLRLRRAIRSGVGRA